jgi:uncharacterized protein (TIGR00255 family)
MIKSMTGYGLSNLETDSLAVRVEVKSLNSKFLDINLKISKEYNEKELEIRNLIANILERGKIGLILEIEEKGDVSPKVTINRELVKQYYKDLKETASLVGAGDTDLFKMALEFPKAVNSDSGSEDNTKVWEQVLKVLADALKKCDEFRTQEGRSLLQKLEEYILKIQNLLLKVDEADPARVQQIREKIKNHLEEYNLTEQVDQNRFEQELIYYIEKLDISEEKVRLKSHLQYFLETLKSSEANGKKLGFIAQEIGREINTIGSKANDASIQRFVVEMKEELEKIKEQSLNIL